VHTIFSAFRLAGIHYFLYNTFMKITYAKETGLALIKRSKIAMLGTIDEKGYPNIKAMMNLISEGLRTIWFSTNTSSKRVAQLQKNNRVSVYYVDEVKMMGLMLVGEIELLQDEESRKKLWFDGCEKYYPKGINDPDYTVLKFTARWGNFYTGLDNATFTINE
jgi:general stress protein 26